MASFCALNLRIEFWYLLFLKQRLLQRRETEASFCFYNNNSITHCYSPDGISALQAYTAVRSHCNCLVINGFLPFRVFSMAAIYLSSLGRSFIMQWGPCNSTCIMNSIHNTCWVARPHCIIRLRPRDDRSAIFAY